MNMNVSIEKAQEDYVTVVRKVTDARSGPITLPVLHSPVYVRRISSIFLCFSVPKLSY